MTATIYAIQNQKGGVGKTTTAVNLAYYLAAIRGCKTLLVDFDIQGHVSTCLGLPKGDGLFRHFVADEPTQSVIISARPHLDIIQSSKKTENVRYAILNRTDRNFIIGQMLGPVLEDYRYIIFDLAPGTDILTIAALNAADYYIIPAKMDYLSLDGVVEAVKTVSSLGSEYVDPPALVGVLPTMFDNVTNETKANIKIIEGIIGGLGGSVLPPIPADTLAREASKKGLALWEYAPEARALVGYEPNKTGRGAYNSMGRVGGYLHLGEIVEAL